MNTEVLLIVYNSRLEVQKEVVSFRGLLGLKELWGRLQDLGQIVDIEYWGFDGHNLRVTGEIVREDVYFSREINIKTTKKRALRLYRMIKNEQKNGFN